MRIIIYLTCMLCIPSDCFFLTYGIQVDFDYLCFLTFYLIEGQLEVFQGEKWLSCIPIWTTFGELAILYNCTRTASVKGNRRWNAVFFKLLHNVKDNLRHCCILSLFVSHCAPYALINRKAMLIKGFILKPLSKWFKLKKIFPSDTCI